VLSIVLSDET